MKSQKRRLYKPAAQETVGTKGKRKTLTQGRLITNSTENDDTKQYALSELDDTKTCREILAKQAAKSVGDPDHSTLTTTNRSLVKSLLSKSGLPHQNDGVENRRFHPGGQSQQWHPREEQPHVSVKESPKLARPTRVLDISDSDSFENEFPDTIPGVVFVDATGQTKASDISEVNISIGMEKSPVKVTCHSPSKVHTDLRNTGSVDIGRKVCIDQVPTVSILADDNVSDTDAPKRTVYKSPKVIRENTIAGSPIDALSTAKPALAKSLFNTLLEEADEAPYGSSFPLPKVMVEKETFPDNNVSVESFNPDPGPPAYSNKELEKKKKDGHKYTKSRNLSQVPDDEGPEKKKKKAPKFVNSRYMQGSRKGPMKATDRSLITKSLSAYDSSTSTGLAKRNASHSINTSNNLSKHNNSSSTRPSSARKQKSNSLYVPGSGHSDSLSKKQSARKMKGIENIHTTPEVAAVQQSHERFSSTPSTNSSIFSSPGDVDVSAIGPMQGMFHNTGGSFHTSPNITASSPARSSQRNHSVTEKTSNNDAIGIAKRKSHRVSQWDLELLYARYMQWVFLDSKAKKSFQDQESNAMTLLCGLWEENDKLRRKKSELDQQLTQLQHLNLLDDALDVQKSGLTPVSNALAQVGQQYHTLAKAVDTTRHQVLTRGVYIPPNDDLHDEALVHAFSESEQLLGELSIMIRSQMPKVTDFANSLEAMEKSVSLEVDELAKCQKLMNHAHDLTVQEVALAVRDIHLSG